MEPVTLVRPNGSGFMHLQRSLQPGEAVPVAPSLVNLLLACQLTHAEEHPEEEVPDNQIDEIAADDEEEF